MIIKSKVEQSENKSYKKSFTEAAVGLAAKAALGYGFNAVASRVAIPGLKRENLRYIQHFTINGVPYAQATGLASTYKTATVKEAIWNAIKATEEMLLKTPRAFSLSAFYGRSIYQSAEIKLEGQILEKQLEYLSKISGGRISKADLAGGLTYRKTRPFGSGSLFNARGEQVLNHAYVYPGLWGEGLYNEGRRVGYTSRFVRALYQQHKMRPPGTDFVITGSNKPWMALTEQVNAFATVAIQNYVKLLDDPFEFVSGHIEKFLGRSNTITKTFGSGSRIFERLGLKNQFGVGGYQFMQGSAWQLMKRHALRGVPKLMAIGAAIKIADTILRTTPVVKDTGLGIGIKGIAAKAYQSITSTFNRVSDITGLTWLSKKQEEAAPGSTSILGLLSFPASAAIAGGTAAKIADIIQKVPIDQKGPRPGLFDSAINYISGKGTVGARIHGALSKTGRVGSWAAMGAAAAFLLTAPLYLGAIGAGRTTEELQDIYSGREEIPVKRGRFWEFGTSPFKGTDTEFYAPHWTVRAVTDASRKGKLPKEFYENPLLYAINRFIDPYAVERRLDKERPYAYWGPTDYGFGIIEKALYPLKAAFKPTVVANDEAFHGVHPATLMRGAADIPAGLEGTYYGLTTQGYIAEPDSPDSLRYQASEFFGSLRDTFGLQGFAISGIMDALTGGQSFLSPPAVYESSGRILSAQRAYWDMALGGAGGSTEFYRRLNPDRPYETEFVGAPIRNLMPEWIGSESLKYGDVYSQIKMGELRLPGRGYAALYPELENVDAENYPLVHRLHILSDVAPMSSSYYHHRNLVEQQIAAGELNSEGIDLYERAIRQRDARLNEDRFDYGEGVLGSYYLALKKMGRALPTESLYPISPVHKFAGPADPITEYKSFELLDKPFKLWQNPYSDYIKPAINRTVDALSVVPFIPQEARERAEINSYFNALQATKNQFLREEADRRAAQGQYEEASYFRSGLRPTVHGMSPFEDFGELTSMLPQNQQRYMESLGEVGDSGYRQRAMAVMAPEMQQILSANWVRSDYMVAGDFDTLNILKKNADPISGLDYPATFGGTMPDRDFIGYAPGVDLNALKVKTVNAMGKNIRDFGLWKEDERQAQIFDAITSTNRNFIQPFATPDREQIRRSMEEYLSKIGMRNGHVTLSPTYGPTSVNLNINKNNQNSIHNTMREEGWISY